MVKMKTRLIDIFNSTNGPRDDLFAQISAWFPGTPNICQIGAIQNWLPAYRKGSGWSDFVWGALIQQRGGHLTVVDINNGALNNSLQAFRDLGIESHITIVNSDGATWLQANKDYNFVYLDGSDNPGEMLDQFRAIDRTKAYVLCDDFSIKGKLMPQELEVLTRFKPVNSLYKIANDMAFYDLEN